MLTYGWEYGTLVLPYIGTGVGRVTCFRFRDTAREYIPGSILVPCGFSTGSLFLAINEATGYSPPLEGIGSKSKGGKQGSEAGASILYPAIEHGTE